MSKENVKQLKGKVFEGSALELEQHAMKHIFEQLDPVNPKYLCTDGDLRIRNGIGSFSWSASGI